MNDEKRITDEGKPDPPLEEGSHDHLPPRGSVKETNRVLLLTILLAFLVIAIIVFAIMTNEPQESEKPEPPSPETGQVNQQSTLKV